MLVAMVKYMRQLKEKWNIPIGEPGMSTKERRRSQRICDSQRIKILWANQILHEYCASLSWEILW
jgi:hypothetical protein